MKLFIKKVMIISFFLTLLITFGCEEKQDPSAKNTDETVVEGHGYVENIELFEQFYSNVKNNKKAEVNIFYIGKDGSNLEANVYYDTNNLNDSPLNDLTVHLKWEIPKNTFVTESFD